MNTKAKESIKKTVNGGVPKGALEHFNSTMSNAKRWAVANFVCVPPFILSGVFITMICKNAKETGRILMIVGVLLVVSVCVTALIFIGQSILASSHLCKSLSASKDRKFRIILDTVKKFRIAACLCLPIPFMACCCAPVPPIDENKIYNLFDIGFVPGTIMSIVCAVGLISFAIYYFQLKRCRVELSVSSKAVQVVKS